MTIETIKQLRISQAAPSAVLETMRETLSMIPGIYLQSIEQTGEQIIIKRNSPDISAVTEFGRRLESIGGLFSNVNIETQRIKNQAADSVNFTIYCSYKPSKANA